jgi:copper chaperone CopZ
METAEIRVDGMTCEGCVKSVARTLQSVPGVQEVAVFLAEGKAKVSFDPGRTRLSELKRAIERAGYEAP